MARAFKLKEFNGDDWIEIRGGLHRQINIAKSHAKEYALEFPELMVAIFDENDHQISTYKYSRNVLLKYNENGWVLDAII